MSDLLYTSSPIELPENPVCFIPRRSLWNSPLPLQGITCQAVFDSTHYKDMQLISDKDIWKHVKEVENEIIQGEHKYLTVKTYSNNKINLSLRLNRNVRLIEVIYETTVGEKRMKYDRYENVGIFSNSLLYDHYPSIRLWDTKHQEVEFFDILCVIIESPLQLLHFVPFDLEDYQIQLVYHFNIQMLSKVKLVNKDVVVDELFVPLKPRYNRNLKPSSGMKDVVDWEYMNQFVIYKMPRMCK